MQKLATALLAAQSDMSNPKKTSKNPFFKSAYSDLNSVREAVLPVLNANGISVLQPMDSQEGKNYVKTILLHTSGEFIESWTEIIYSKQNDAQSQGSGITYARRYGLQSMVCVGADDDDGAAASNNKSATSNNTTYSLTKAQTESKIAAAKSKSDLTAIKSEIAAHGLNDVATAKAKTLK